MPLMPENAAVLTALILERPLCLDCITAKASMTEPDVDRGLARIGGVLVLRRFEHERCRTCGEVREVLSLERPLG